MSRAARIVAYLGVLIITGIALYLLNQVGYLIVEVLVIIMTTIPEKIRETIFGKKPEDSVERGLVRAERLRKVTADLDSHYKGVIGRMAQEWDYQPKMKENKFSRKARRPDRHSDCGDSVFHHGCQ